MAEVEVAPYVVVVRVDAGRSGTETTSQVVMGGAGAVAGGLRALVVLGSTATPSATANVTKGTPSHRLVSLPVVTVALVVACVGTVLPVTAQQGSQATAALRTCLRLIASRVSVLLGSLVPSSPRPVDAGSVLVTQDPSARPATGSRHR